MLGARSFTTYINVQPADNRTRIIIKWCYLKSILIESYYLYLNSIQKNRGVPYRRSQYTISNMTICTYFSSQNRRCDLRTSEVWTQVNTVTFTMLEQWCLLLLCFFFTDPYIKVCIYRGSQRLKKKKTDTKHNTNNPVFNQALIFSVSPELLQCPIVRITCHAVHDQKLAYNENLGYIEIGPSELSQLIITSIFWSLPYSEYTCTKSQCFRIFSRPLSFESNIPQKHS